MRRRTLIERFAEVSCLLLDGNWGELLRGRCFFALQAVVRAWVARTVSSTTCITR